jgi:glycosyltransferase involved in cell wall biosynthesis
MKKILHIYKSYMPETTGGIENSIDNLCTSLKSDVYFEIFVLSKNKNCIIKNNGIKVHFCKSDFEISSCPISFQSLKYIKKISKKFDIIHYHYPWPFMDFIDFFIDNKKKRIVTYHSDIIKQNFLKKLYFPLKKIFFKKINHIIVTSQNFKKNSNFFNNALIEKKTSVIPIGLNKKLYKEKKTKLVTKNFFIFIGTIRYYKGINFLIDAFKKINSNLVIIGEDKDKIIENLNLNEKNIFYLGKVSNNIKNYYIKKSKCVILPSIKKSEAFGISLLEGLMYGKPLISTKLGTGTDFVNKNGNTGIVIKPSSVIALINAVKKIETEDSLVKIYGINAKKRFENKFNNNITLKKYLELYKK